MSQTIILGAGPAGLAAAYELAKAGKQVLVLEKQNQVGGLCRTIERDGFRFDLGGHRFFTKSEEVQKFWQKILVDDFLKRPRLSRIYYRKKFFKYPIQMGDALKKLGLAESVLSALSLIKVKIKRIFIKKKEVSFEDWVTSRFGERLFNHFFKSYTEKVWGISTKELGADWAAQRLKDISLWQVLKSFIFKPKKGKVKSWINEFGYPKFGPGQMYEEISKQIEKMGGEVILDSEVVGIKHEGGKIKEVIVRNKRGESETFAGENFIVSLPLTVFLKILEPEIPQEINDLKHKLRFRSFFDVCLVVNKEKIFPDTWIYVHEPNVKLVRVQNFKNWSPFMTADKNKTNLAAEYICWESDDLWQKGDDELVELGKKEITQLGLVDLNLIEKGFVIRNSHAYPVYHLDYQKDLKIIFEYLKGFKNLQLIGRSGMYRYNNMDHSILTGFYAARNLLGEKHDVFTVNADEEYLES